MSLQHEISGRHRGTTSNESSWYSFIVYKKKVSVILYFTTFSLYFLRHRQNNADAAAEGESDSAGERDCGQAAGPGGGGCWFKGCPG